MTVHNVVSFMQGNESAGEGAITCYGECDDLRRHLPHPLICHFLRAFPQHFHKALSAAVIKNALEILA